MKPSRFATLVAVALLSTDFTLAEEPIDEAVIARIKVEGFQRSQVMATARELTDVYGPRLTGSPGLRAASEWCVARLGEWGLTSPHLESWGEFGRGWSLTRHSVEMTAPRYSPLITYPHAWSPSTPGKLTGSPVLVEIETPADYDEYRGKLRGRIVLRGRPKAQSSRFEAPASRLDEADLEEGRRVMGPGEPRGYLAEDAAWQADIEKEKKALQFLRDEGVGVIIEPSPLDGDIVRVTALGYYLGNGGEGPPSLVMAKEHYGRIVRLLDDEVPVTLEIDVETAFHDDDPEEHNVIADLPGEDPDIGDEIVLIGAHLDSWHSGTGATDNAAGSAVVMETMRILKAIGAHPRRTIRLALWTGEEQGYFGSVGYVKKHLGDPQTLELLPEHAKLAVYLNLDNGAGRIRGVYLQGNEAARPIFEALLAPFAYLDAATLTAGNTGETDHMPFIGLGLPGFQFLQDPLDYDTRTHHTNLDVYENLIEDDLEQAAAVLASVAYHAAMRDEKFPRPPLPTPEPSKRGTTEPAAGRAGCR